MVESTKLSALEFFQDHHKTITGLFRQFDRQRLPQEIFDEIEVHGKIEREILYPVLEHAAGKKVRLESLDALEAVENVMIVLKKMSLHDPRYLELFDGLIEDFEYHMREEEAELRLLSLARPDLFEGLGTKMQNYRHRHHNFLGGEQKRKPA